MSFENNFIKLSFDKNTKTLTILVKNELPLVKEEFEQLINSLTVFYKGCETSKTRFRLWFDIRNLGILTVEYYKQVIQFFRNNETISENYLIGTIVLSKNNTINTFINKMINLYDNKRPFKITNSEQEGLDFLNQYS